MTSYLQIVTNEIVLRTKEHQVQVVFEPGVKKFLYGNPRLSVLPMKSLRSANTFVRKEAQQKTSALLSENAPQKLKDDMDMTDEHLDQISDILGDLGDIAITIGDEIDRSAEQLDRVSDRVDDANTRIGKSNKRMDNLM